MRQDRKPKQEEVRMVRSTKHRGGRSRSQARVQETRNEKIPRQTNSGPVWERTKCTNQRLGIESSRLTKSTKHILNCCSPYFTVRVHRCNYHICIRGPFRQ